MSATVASRRVLIVEDDSDYAELEQRVLRHAGFASLVVNSLTDARDSLEAGDFVALLLDYQLPDGSAWDLLAVARDTLPHMPVLMVTAMGNEAVAAEAVRRGVSEYIRKADGYFEQLGAALERVILAAQAREELDRNGSLFRTIANYASDAIVLLDADDAILWASAAAQDVFGAEQRGLIGRKLEALLHPDDRLEWRNGGRWANAARNYYFRCRDRTGRYLSFEPTFRAIDEDSGPRTLVILRDVTLRLQLEERLRLVQQVAGVAYSDRDLGEPMMLISPEFVRLYALPAGQTHISIAAWAALLHPDDRERVLTGRPSMLDGGNPHSIEFRICRSDGEVRWVTMRTERFLGPNGRPARIISAQQDITEVVTAREALTVRQQALEQRVAERTAALAEAEAQFRGIFDSQFQFINLLAPDGTVLEANRTALDAGGLRRDAVVGQPLWATGWWPAAERDQLRKEIAQAARGTAIRREVEINGAGGRTIWIDFSLTPTRDPATEAVKWVIAEGRDLTEKRHLAAQLVQGQKMQALGQLAGGIAHDFNNILQAVSGAGQLIANKPGDHDRTLRLVGAIMGAANRGASITQRLLSFARRGDLRSETIDTHELISSVREVLAHTLSTTIAVRTDVAPDVPPLIADRAQLETAIINLGTNARDAMPDGGTLLLSAATETVANGAFHPAGLEPGGYVRLSVGDDGTGMDAATLARASEPFFTTKPQGQGTGLGLAMVRGFAEQSGGALSIVSTPGSGTTVTLWLRRATGDVGRAGDDRFGGQISVQNAARILLVDDDDLVREVVAASLEEAGLDVLMASSGVEAIGLIEAGEIVDAMVSDLSMPGIDGVTTIQRVRALRPRLLCFLLTGYVGEQAALAAAGEFTLLRKPVSGRALVAQIEAGLEGTRR